MAYSHQVDVGERRASRQSGRSRTAVFTAVGTFYVAAALLNGRFLHEDAEDREYGRTRDIWVAATRPLSDISTFLHLDRLRGSVETLRND